MKPPKVAALDAAPEATTPPSVTWPTTGGSYIGNDETGELIRVEPVVKVAEPEPAAPDEPRTEEPS